MAGKRMRNKNEEEDYDDIPDSVKKMSKKSKKKKKKHIFLRIVLILLAIIVILVGILAGYGYSKLAGVKYDDIDENEIEVTEGIETTGYRNIVLFGVDSRQNSYEHTLSDSIMIISINQDTHKVRIASVYRDTYLKIGSSYDKITHAFAKGGPTLSLSTLNTNLDLDLKEYVAVNFNVVVDVIDAVGGIDLEITSDEVKYINGYIDEVNSVTGHNSEHITKAGTYHVDGVQAVAYSRIRYTSGGDYKRTERQRDILNLAFEKIKTMNLFELNNLVNIIFDGETVSTNISTTQIIGLLSQVANYEIEDTIGWPETKGYQPDAVWYGAPVNLEKQVQELHAFLFDEEDYQVSSTVKSISDTIIKRTGYK